MIKKSPKTTRVMVSLHKEDIRLLDLLCDDMGETRSHVVKRALEVLAMKKDRSDHSKQ